MISERCISAGEHPRQRVEQVARDHPGAERGLDRGPVVRRRARGRRQPRVHALGEERGDHPGQDVARPGRRERGGSPPSTRTPAPGAAISVPAPLSRTTQPKRSTARRTAASRCASTHDASSPISRASSPECGVSTRRRRPLGRLERPERVPVDDGRQLAPREHAPHERLRPVAPPEARADRERARLLDELEHRAAASSVTSPSPSEAAAASPPRAPSSRAQASRLRAGERHVARVGAERRQRRRGRARRSSRASRRRRRRAPDVYLLPSGCAAEPGRGLDLDDAPVRGLERLEADVRDLDVAGEERARAST